MPVQLGSNGFPVAAPVKAHPMRPQITNAENRKMLAQRFPDVNAARFDLQFTTNENQQLWALSDIQSVDAQANFMVRRTLRMRCRYAYHNNPYAMGAANRLAKFVIGSAGPKLHLATDDKDTNDQVEKSFHRWMEKVALARKLRVSRAARFYNGEGFNLLRTNPKIKHPVKLDVFEIEADQVSSPLFGIFPAQYPDQLFDGLILDPWGNKEIYHVLRQHPGAFGAFLVMGYEFDPWPAQYVLHDYARLRPAQQRGIPEMTPAAQDWEELRRYSKAVIAAAETAADFAGFVKTVAPTEATTEADTGWGTDMDYINVRRRQMGVLPGGAEIMQMKAEQPTTVYSEFVLAKLMEIAQTMDMPLFLLTGDARLANMSSAYVATASFINSVKSDRQEYGLLMDQIFEEWLLEARRIPGLIPKDLPYEPEYSWRWEKVSNHADPGKVTTAQRTRMQNGESPSTVFADDGLDFDEMISQGAGDYGVSEEELRASLFQSIFAQRGTPPPASIAPGTGDQPAQGDVDPNA